MKNLLLLISISLIFSSCKKYGADLSEKQREASLLYSYDSVKTFFLKSNLNQILICELIKKDIYDFNIRGGRGRRYGEAIKLDFLINYKKGTFKTYTHYTGSLDDYFYTTTVVNFPFIGNFEFSYEENYYGEGNGLYFIEDTVINDKTYHNVYSFRNNEQEICTTEKDGVIFIKNGLITFVKIE